MKLILASCIGWYFKTKTPEKAVWYEKSPKPKKNSPFSFLLIYEEDAGHHFLSLHTWRDLKK